MFELPVHNSSVLVYVCRTTIKIICIRIRQGDVFWNQPVDGVVSKCTQVELQLDRIYEREPKSSR